MAETTAGTLTTLSPLTANDSLLIGRSTDGKAYRFTRDNALGLFLPDGYLHGLQTELDTDADHDIKINVGLCKAAAADKLLELASILTKQIDAAWAAGDDAGGLFSGSVAANTWYHLFLIEKDSDGSIDAGFDTSVSAANIPSGYTNYRRIASLVTDGSNNFVKYVQRGNDFYRANKVDISTPGSPPTSATAISVGIPTTADQWIGFLKGERSMGMGSANIKLWSSQQTTVGLEDFIVPDNSSQNSTAQCRVPANSQQIAYSASSSSDWDLLEVITIGWVDSRGQ